MKTAQKQFTADDKIIVSWLRRLVLLLLRMSIADIKWKAQENSAEMEKDKESKITIVQKTFHVVKRISAMKPNKQINKEDDEK